ncbi:MAG: hypothetical protein EXS03_04245 [Phycisphaerales bacterium]|nr:hypothetical protein [Phycisphaerales bacterium]
MKDAKPSYNINRLNSLVLKWGARARAEEPNTSDLLALFIHSTLLADASTEMADNAMQKIRSQNVDFNEFRVSLVDEMVAVIGVKYPDAFQRMRGLRMTMFDLFRRHHKVSLDQLIAKPTKDVKIYMENLEGMPPFVSTRFLLLGFGYPSVPVDWTTIDFLMHEEVLNEPIEPAQLMKEWSKKFKSERARAIHFALVAGTDAFHAGGKASKARKARESTPKLSGAAAASAEAAKKGKASIRSR